MASHTTRDHDEIQRWAEAHGATPSVVSRTGGMLRFEFSDNPGELSEVSWDDFFQVFDERGLELVYDDKRGSRFHKLVYPETVEGKAAAPRRGRAKIEPIRGRGETRAGASKTAASRTAAGRTTGRKTSSKRPAKAKPRVTRTGTKAAAKKSTSTRRHPRAA
ncbi:MAG: hypothetical protein ACRD1Y_00395 [Terriglobales bacterium]